jgi:hypothetical protein
MPGEALAIPDDLSHGPLDDGRARIDYMRARYRGYDDWCFDTVDAFAPWHRLLAVLDGDREEVKDDVRPDAIVLWAGDNPSEGSFLAMACHRLRERSEPVFHVPTPVRAEGHYVAIYSPAELAARLPHRRALGERRRALYAEDFLRLRDETGLLRRWEDGRIIGVPPDRYDALLLASCAADWLPAARVVGAAMGRCDPHNRISDLFFCSRLQVLIDAGRIEADGRRQRLRDYAIRLC